MMAVFNRLKQQTMPIDELQKNKQNTESLRDKLRTRVVLRKPDQRRKPFDPNARFQANLRTEQKKQQIRLSGKIPGVLNASVKNGGSGNAKRKTNARDRLKSVLTRPSTRQVTIIQIRSTVCECPSRPLGRPLHFVEPGLEISPSPRCQCVRQSSKINYNRFSSVR